MGANLHDHPLAGITYSGSKSRPPVPGPHTEVIAMVRSRPDLPAPDVHLVFLDIAYLSPMVPRPANGYTIGFAFMLPHSRGTVRLAGSDPATAPLIDPNFRGHRPPSCRLYSLQAGDQTLGRDGPVGVGDDFGDLGPVLGDVEVDAEPAAVADV
ncbi:hypothetical protein AB0M44_22580 [Streptosporangium subroseum]|uniref:hypothetical protein n=1 Tax=Streptosporangium subroseum TaxID=106412 RepID=UPI00342FA306